MITQKIIARTDSLKLDKIISRYGEDSMRHVIFIIARPDPESEELIPITIPEDAVGSFRILKPSGNFVIVPMNKSVLSTGETAFDVVLPASANTAKGSGYYDIRITSDTDKYYFTAQGDFLIDDNIISDEVLEDVSEVNGLVFPDDFLTTDDHFAEINDNVTSTESTWSSDKINDEIEEAIASIPSPIKEYSTTPKIIGTWIDGRNVYEYVKPISISIPDSGSTTDVSLSEVPSSASILSVSAINNNVGWGSGGLNQCVPCFCMQWNGYPNVGIAQFSPWAFSCTHLIIQYIDN